MNEISDLTVKSSIILKFKTDKVRDISYNSFLPEFNKLENLFAADVTKVVPLVLFSQNKNPDISTIDYFKRMPDLARKISAEWFIRNKFEGIYYLSPLLLFSFFSIILFIGNKSGFLEIFGVLWVMIIAWVRVYGRAPIGQR